MNKYLEIAAGVVSGSLAGKTLSIEERGFLKKYKPIGLTVFSRNIHDENYREFRLLADSIQACYQDPMGCLIKVDQEGGRVRRFKAPFPNLGPALQMCQGPKGHEEDCLLNHGKQVGEELSSLGVHVNFAPVCDIHTNLKNDAIGDRCFGTDLKNASTRASAYLKGMQQSPVLGCLKHFPGQGDASFDTHVSKAEINLPYEHLMGKEIECFRKLLSQTSMVMISHCIYPELDPDFPASSSEKIQVGILRQKLGFEGVIVSDDMTMGAIDQDLQLWKKSMIESVMAGTDLLLICSGLDRWKEGIHTLAEMAQKSPKFAARLMEASARVNDLHRLVRSRFSQKNEFLPNSTAGDRNQGSLLF